jgi:zona occludens toxin (predicted ATPase)
MILFVVFCFVLPCVYLHQRRSFVVLNHNGQPIETTQAQRVHDAAIVANPVGAPIAAPVAAPVVPHLQVHDAQVQTSTPTHSQQPPRYESPHNQSHV